MKDSTLQKNAEGVVLALRALQTNKSGLRKIKKALTEFNKTGRNFFYDEPAKRYTDQGPNEGYDEIRGFLKSSGNLVGASKTMVYDTRSVHNGHTMEYVPGTGQTNPEYFNF
jgi:hypothetical protein